MLAPAPRPTAKLSLFMLVLVFGLFAGFNFKKANLAHYCVKSGDPYRSIVSPSLPCTASDFPLFMLVGVWCFFR